MMKLSTIAAAIVLLIPAGAFAHRLDQYLEATILTIQSDRVEASLRLVPGVTVSSEIIAAIDTNADGMLSEAEEQAYAQRVLGDLLLSVDGQRLVLHLTAAGFPSLEQMQQGVGEIQLTFTASLPPGPSSRKLTFENHHQPRISACLVNTLVPTDKNIQITAQTRNDDQSFYQLEFSDEAAASLPLQSRHFPPLSGFAGAFRLGLHHIAQGTDHLLFLLALLLPAPLLACGGRWGQSGTVRTSLRKVFTIVTAFTLGHSLTLALAASGFVHVPSRPIEVLIAVSILVSALHAIRPIFPGREAIIATFFGLIHGLAFATALSHLGFDGWYHLVSLLGFNLGIETMQLAVVAATMPSLLLLSRTNTYTPVRIICAIFALAASLGWIVERTLNTLSTIDPILETIAHHAPWIAATLFLLSLINLLWQRLSTVYAVTESQRQTAF